LGAAADRQPRERSRRAVRLAAEVGGATLIWAGLRVARAEHWTAVLAERQPTHAKYWRDQAEIGGPTLYVALGDSTAQGIGANHPSQSYVGQLTRLLSGRSLRVVNLSISGATLTDVISIELPRLAALELDDALITFAAGANNIEGFDAELFTQQLRLILDRLPSHALIAEIPSFYVHPYEADVATANAIIHRLADQRGMAVVPLHRATNRIGPLALATHHAADIFHPNHRGYRVWARTFLPAAQARLAEIIPNS
jgi:lysophospholipase L1-like esterase